MKHTYVYALVEALNCNPNGDPSNSNYPRILELSPEVQRLEISSYAIKRKMRYYWERQGEKIILPTIVHNKKTIPEAYKEALGNLVKVGWKTKTDKEQVDMSELTFENLKEYKDSIFWLFMSGALTGLKPELFDQLKQYSLQIPTTQSFHNYKDISHTFRKANTTHFVSESGNNQGSIGSFCEVVYSLFPIVGFSLNSYSTEERRGILDAIYYGFNENTTSSKNYVVKGVIVATTDMYIKKNYLSVNNEKDITKPIEFIISEKADTINLEHCQIIDETGKVKTIENITLREALESITS